MSITSLLAVGTGGALGAIGRWGLSLLPFRGEFPLLTLVTNLLGAVLIGFIAGWAEEIANSRSDFARRKGCTMSKGYPP